MAIQILKEGFYIYKDSYISYHFASSFSQIIFSPLIIPILVLAVLVALGHTVISFVLLSPHFLPTMKVIVPAYNQTIMLYG